MTSRGGIASSAVALLTCVLAAQACSSAASPDGGTTGTGGASMSGPSSSATMSTAATGSTSASGTGGAGGSTGSGYTKLPCNVMVGNGSGSITVTGSTGNPGDVICIVAGTYSGGSITSVSDRTIQNDGGLVTITGVVDLANLDNVTLSGSGDDTLHYGFQLNGAAASFVITGPNTGLLIHDFEAVDAGIFLDAGHTDLIYTGDPSTLVLYQSKLDELYLHHTGQLFQCNYGSVDDLKNFASDVEMAHVVVEDSQGQGQNVVGGAGIFNLNAHDWTVTGPNTVVVGSNDDRDTGVFLFAGSGSVKRIHRNGGWGWMVRNFGAQIGPTKGEFRCEDNVDLNTEYYGTCESRNGITPDVLIPGTLSPIDIFIQNNVSGHKLDKKGSYTTAIALIPSLIAGTTATLTNNVGCDNAQDYGDMESLHFFGPIDGTVVKSGNQQLTSCSGITDPITGLTL